MTAKVGSVWATVRIMTQCIRHSQPVTSQQTVFLFCLRLHPGSIFLKSPGQHCLHCLRDHNGTKRIVFKLPHLAVEMSWSTVTARVKEPLVLWTNRMSFWSYHPEDIIIVIVNVLLLNLEQNRSRMSNWTSTTFHFVRRGCVCLAFEE